MKKLIFVLAAISFLIYAQDKRAITVEDLWSMKRIGTFDLSPDGSLLAFSLTSYSMEENKGNQDIYIINSDGSGLRQLKASAQGESEPVFSPDGKKLAFIRNSQIWISDVDGSNEEQITDIYTGASGIEWSPKGDKILFKSSVYPECSTDDCSRKKDEASAQSKVKAKIYTELMYRHWNEWRGDKRSHLFVVDINEKKPVDLNLNSSFDVPPLALGSSNDFNFSPSGNEISYTQNLNEKVEISTDNDVFIIDLDSPQNIKKISPGKGNDNQPVFSPDGKYIAFTSMERTGYEADKLNIIIHELGSGKQKNLTENFDRSASEIIWSPESDKIYFSAPNEIYKSFIQVELNSGKITELKKEVYSSALRLSNNGKTLFFINQKTVLPAEIFALDLTTNNLTQVTSINKGLLSKLDMNPAETFWCKGAEGIEIQSVLIKPPFFDKNKKYPVIFLIHGGPQGHWSDDFHYRWNAQLFASKGYVVVTPNPTGSIGYGQKLTDAIRGDWGGKPYVDIMNVYDFAVKNFSFLDSTNTFAAGGSYGGYMVNWIAGHSTKFNAMVSHAGVFNLESMWGTTEELWFPEWEYLGTPWENRQMYERWSPHRYIHNAKTPVLVVHGANDFRVPEEQAFQLFTSLRRLGVESRFLYFPDEYHFVTKPQNAVLWWNTIFDWFNEHLNKEKK